MTSAQQHSALAATNCEVAFDNLTRQLYATDASIYQVEPIAVAFPKNVKQAKAIIKEATQAGIPIIPRGAGTGLTGGAIGEGLVIDFARYNRQITDLDLEKRIVRVGPGVVLDQLNDFLRPEGFCFGPDVATSSRATLGGMIANDSSGAHTPVYGTTADHIASLELVLAGGHLERITETGDTLPHQHDLIENLVAFNSLAISETFPPGLLKRWPGYGLSRALKQPGNLINIIAGSEGTLAAIVSAEVKIVPLPRERGLALIFFKSVAEAMQASVELLDLKPAAIEHMDKILFDQTRGQLEFLAARDLLELDSSPCEAILCVEFFEDVLDRLAAVAKRKLGFRTTILRTQAEANLVWSVRKAGLSLLTSRKGDAKPVTGIEDTAVAPKKLPEYFGAFSGLLKRLGLQASFYGHAAAGLLHVRPVLDLHSRDDVKKFRHIANEVSALVKEFNGSLAAEHGVGIARTEFMQQQVGEHMLNLMREIKDAFDPHHVFNPGKIIPDGRWELDSDLRVHAGRDLALPFEPMLAFASRDESFVRNLEQCNGCGACIKMTPSMCPTYIATGEEYMSTRGRANAIRAALEMRGQENGDPLRWVGLDDALSNCLSCRACLKECPSNVDLSLLKAELQHAQIRRDGLPLRARLLSNIDRLGRIGTFTPRLANLFLDSSIMRFFGSRFLGITSRRSLPHYAKKRFDKWFDDRKEKGTGNRGRVILWDDTFVRYHEPNIGISAVKVLEAAGFEVALVKGRECCGRPAFSQGNLDAVVRLGSHNLELLSRDVDDAPILFLEPSCYSMFISDYRELKLPNSEGIAERCILFQQFMEDFLSREPDALKFSAKSENVIIHVHCHVKALTNPASIKHVAERLPERRVTLLDSGCCGMAGAFGMAESKYDLSVKIAEPLIAAVRQQPFGTIFVTSGASCRHQVQHLTLIRSRHIAELLAEALDS
jgi:FAD/FMN-containing dehydrogenase/Fe-S oxidoreductase